MDATIGLRERKKLETRRSIEAAALALFSQHGFAQTTMSDIARAADVSLRTVAVHYPTKHDLVFADHDRMFEQLMEQVADRPHGTTTLDAMHAWIVELIGAGAAEDPTRAACSNIIHSDPDLLARARGTAARIQPVLAAGIARDFGLPVEHLTPTIAAAAVTGIFTTLAEADKGDDAAHDSAESVAAIDQVFGFLRAGIATLPRD